ncbi:MAG TPA: spore germination protein GerW family protein [Dehalococcoidia bacterium]|nr:spore germination protein GerW family protein [Dehalococcoidia bacterium]
MNDHEPVAARIINSVVEGFRGQFTAHTVYGEPVSRDGVTVIPAATVRLAFGGGGGGGGGVQRTAVEGQEPREGYGSGGGGGGTGRISPAGFIEISDRGARWVPVEPSPQEVALRLALLVALLLLARRGMRGVPFARLFLARRAASPVLP